MPRRVQARPSLVDGNGHGCVLPPRPDTLTIHTQSQQDLMPAPPRPRLPLCAPTAGISFGVIIQLSVGPVPTSTRLFLSPPPHATPLFLDPPWRSLIRDIYQ